MAPQFHEKKKKKLLSWIQQIHQFVGLLLIFPVSYYQKQVDKDPLDLQDLWVIAIDGPISGCLLNPFLIGLLGLLGALDSAFLPLKLLFVFFFFLSGSLGGVGSGLGNSKIDEG
jgi:hypothetical protein